MKGQIKSLTNDYMISRKIKNYRWLILTLLVSATTIN